MQMFVQLMYTNCLAQAAYYIESEGEAAIIDPLRDPKPYMDLAKDRNATIKYVLETHFHADFVSGHLDLAKETGATIVFGPDAQPGYPAHIATDGEQLKVGKVTLEVLHTPGHTIESACYLLRNEQGTPEAVFTGDTLFVGEVGRPDLMSGNLDKETLAGMLYDSLQRSILTLPDDVIVYPGHGAGSACGKNIGKESQSTIGIQKLTNMPLRIQDRQQFIETVTTGLPAAPQYFFTDAGINRKGYDSYQEQMEQCMRPISAEDCLNYIEHGAVVLDSRPAATFSKGHISGALNIGLSGDYAVWAGTLLGPDEELIVVAEAGKEQEAIERLARIGYTNVKGYLPDNAAAWTAANLPTDTIPVLDIATIAEPLMAGTYNLLDVRTRNEVAKCELQGAMHIPLNELMKQMDTMLKNGLWVVCCAAGYRSMIAASLMKRYGFHHVSSVNGGVNEIKTTMPELIHEPTTV